MPNIKFDPKKFAELILYVAEKSKHDKRFGAVKLNKILFYADFAAYRTLGQAITGAEYQHIPEGPAPKALLPIRNEMIREGIAHMEYRQYYNGVQERIVADRPPEKVFSEEELAIVDEIIEDLWYLNGKEVTLRSHSELGWKLTRYRETIPYSAAWFSSDPITLEEEEIGQRIADELGLRVKESDSSNRVRGFQQ
jgi:hypothetical protein